MNARRRWILAIAAASVLVAAIDTYVIVLALPAIMADVGIGIDQLQAATPIISGFLLGYVVVMPLLGRLSDLYGRRPLLLLCLAVFAARLAGHRVRAPTSAPWSRAGRSRASAAAVWCPVTLALVADLWPAERRGVPLGVIGGVQELGSVLGPLYGGLILTVATWQTIFWLNLPIAAALGARAVRRQDGVIQDRQQLHGVRGAEARPRLDRAGRASRWRPGASPIAAPDALRNNDTSAWPTRALGGLVWLTPIALVAAGAAVGARSSGSSASHRSTRRADRGPAPPGGGGGGGLARARRCSAIALATIIVSFSAEDPIDRRDLAGGALAAAARRVVGGGASCSGSGARARRSSRRPSCARAAPTARCSPTSRSARR